MPLVGVDAIAAQSDRRLTAALPDGSPNAISADELSARFTVPEEPLRRDRRVRACEVLEGIGTPDAVQLLRAWAGGPPGARLTIEAKGSWDRLKP